MSDFENYKYSKQVLDDMIAERQSLIANIEIEIIQLNNSKRMLSDKEWREINAKEKKK